MQDPLFWHICWVSGNARNSSSWITCSGLRVFCNHIYLFSLFFRMVFFIKCWWYTWHCDGLRAGKSLCKTLPAGFLFPYHLFFSSWSCSSQCCILVSFLKLSKVSLGQYLVGKPVQKYPGIRRGSRDDVLDSRLWITGGAIFQKWYKDHMWSLTIPWSFPLQ